jgi:hypothetical protein
MIVTLYSLNPTHSPDEREIRARLPARLQALLAGTPPA